MLGEAQLGAQPNCILIISLSRSLFISKVRKRNIDCTCSIGAKKWTCKQMTLIAAQIKITTIPAEAKAIPLEAKGKRGRPGKANPALLWNVRRSEQSVQTGNSQLNQTGGRKSDPNV